MGRPVAPNYDRLLAAFQDYYAATTRGGKPYLPTGNAEIAKLAQAAALAQAVLVAVQARRERELDDISERRKARAKRQRRMAMEHLAAGAEMTTTSRTDITRGLINASIAKALAHRGLVTYLDNKKLSPRRVVATPKLIEQLAKEQAERLEGEAAS
jgi:short subunit dehydrogenase-like uncharacterized protein